MPGWLSFTALTARQIRLSGLVASRASGVFRAGSMTANTATAGMPRSFAPATASTNRSMESLSTPGMEGTASRFASPSIAKTGQIRSSVLKAFSATRRRDQS